MKNKTIECKKHKDKKFCLNVAGLEIYEKVVSDHKTHWNSNSKSTETENCTEKPHLLILNVCRQPNKCPIPKFSISFSISCSITERGRN